MTVSDNSISRIKVRFAPSPTGNLHLGNARLAVLNYLYALKYDGDFYLRIDDTDKERSKQEYVDSIQEDLHWLGIEWKEIFFQSNYLNDYQEALEKLKGLERAYPCYESQSDLEFKRKLQIKLGKPPVYDRSALKLTKAEIANLEKQGKKPHWRFLLKGDRATWKEMNRDEIKLDMSSLSDPVLMREDAQPLYTLSSVIDDIRMEISHIIRGEDHLTNTAVQLQLFDSMSKSRPEKFMHASLLTDKDGNPLSKRLNSVSLQSLRENGIMPMAIVLLLGSAGNSQPAKFSMDMKELANSISFESFGNNPVPFDESKLKKINLWVIRNTKWEDAKGELLKDFTEDFWYFIRPNVTSWNHANLWHKAVFNNEKIPYDNNSKIKMDVSEDIIKYMNASLTKHKNNWEAFIKDLEKETSMSETKLIPIVRYLLTAQEHGPEIEKIFEYMSYDIKITRIKDAQNTFHS